MSNLEKFLIENPYYFMHCNEWDHKILQMLHERGSCRVHISTRLTRETRRRLEKTCGLICRKIDDEVIEYEVIND